MKVSVIATVLNEAETIRDLMDSLVAQTRAPDEVIIVDGGSKDGTTDILVEYKRQLRLKMIVSPGANISQGRNRAIREARGPIIACTDSGVRLSMEWLKELTIHFSGSKSPQVVAGFFQSDARNPFEAAMGAVCLPLLASVDPATFLPSSRSIAFTKKVWEAVNGYPEWLDYCEDLVFDFKLKVYAGKLAFAPAAVAHFRPRGSLSAFFKQYYLYARGDGKADLWRSRHAVRYLTYLFLAPFLGWLAVFNNLWWGALGLVLGSFGLFWTPYRRLIHIWDRCGRFQKVQAILWIPIIRITGDIAKLIGYPAGMLWRLGHIKDQPLLDWRAATRSNDAS